MLQRPAGPKALPYPVAEGQNPDMDSAHQASFPTPVLAATDPDSTREGYREALDAELDDTQHGFVQAGIHLGALTGTGDDIERGFAGLRLKRAGITRAGISTGRNIAYGLDAVAFTAKARGHVQSTELTMDRGKASSVSGSALPLRVQVHEKAEVLPAGESPGFPLLDDRQDNRP